MTYTEAIKILDNHPCKNKYDRLWVENAKRYVDFIYANKCTPKVNTYRELAYWMRNNVTLQSRSSDTLMIEARYNTLNAIFPGIVDNFSNIITYMNNFIQNEIIREDIAGVSIDDTQSIVNTPNLEVTAKMAEIFKQNNIKHLDDIIQLINRYYQLRIVEKSSNIPKGITKPLIELGIIKYESSLNRKELRELKLALATRICPSIPVNYIVLYIALTGDYFATALYKCKKIPKLVRNTQYVIRNGLTEREQTVIRYRFGLDNGTILTLEDTSKYSGLNVTMERARQIEAKALRKMRHPKLMNLIHGYRTVSSLTTKKVFIGRSEFKHIYLSEIAGENKLNDCKRIFGASVERLSLSEFCTNMESILNDQDIEGWGSLDRSANKYTYIKMYKALLNNPAVLDKQSKTSYTEYIPDEFYSEDRLI